MSERIPLTISQIKKDLKDGLDREAIGEKYGLRPFEVRELFQNPKLKGLRVKTKVNFDLVDDEADTTATASATQSVADAPEASAAPSKKSTKAKAAPAPKVVVEDDEEEEEATVSNVTASEIKEVASSADTQEAKDAPPVSTSKGLW